MEIAEIGIPILLSQQFLQHRGNASFYYVSHAPFLFVAQDPKLLDSVLQRLLFLGLPACRFEAAGMAGR
jgi:hypothetical protein